MKKSNEGRVIKVGIKIFSDILTPEEITSKLQLQPSEFHEKGTPMKGSSRLYRRTLWLIYSGLDFSCCYDDQFNYLIEKLDRKKQQLLELSSQDGTDVYFDIVVYDSSGLSGISIEKKTLQFVHNTGMNMDIDFYGYLPKGWE